MFRSTLQTVHEALTSDEEHSDSSVTSGGSIGANAPMFFVAPNSSSVDSEDSFDASKTGRSSSLTDHLVNATNKATSTGSHGVTMVTPPNDVAGAVKFLHFGTTVLHLDPDTHQICPVFLKLENCNGTVTWFRPPWTDPRKPTSGGTGSTGVFINTDDSTTNLDRIEDSVSPGLRLKYTNRSGESIVYTDEGYVDLAHMKDLVGGI
jgi:hypothetical protein